MAKQYDLAKMARKGIKKVAEKAGEKRAPEKTQEGAKKVKTKKIAAPALHTSGDQPMIEKIYQHAAEQRTPYYYSTPVTEPVFAPADPELTKQMVPQVSIAGQL